MANPYQQAIADIQAGMPVEQLPRYYPELADKQDTFNQYAADIRAGMPTSVAAQYYPDLFPSATGIPSIQKPTATGAGFIAKDILGGGAELTGNEGLGGILGKTLVQSTIGSHGAAGLGQKVAGVIGDIFGNTAGQAEQLSQSQAGLAEQTTNLIKYARTIQDPEAVAKVWERINENLQQLGQGNQAYQDLTRNGEATQSAGQYAREYGANAVNTALTAASGQGNLLKSSLGKGAAMAGIENPALIGGAAKVLNYGNSLLPRVAEQAAIGAGFVGAENLRENKPLTENMGTAALIGGAFPVAGTGISAVKNKAFPLLARNLVESLIKPLPKMLRYGADPVEGVLSEVGAFKTLEEGTQKIQTAKEQVGELLGQRYNTFSANQKAITLSDVTKPLDEAIAAASKGGEVNSGVIKRLQDAKNAILNEYELIDGVLTLKGSRKLTYVKPSEAFNLKQTVEGITKYTGNVSDDTLVNSALQQVYTGIKNKLNEVLPGLAELNERYANLVTAQKAIERQALLSQTGASSVVSHLLGYGAIVGGIGTLNPGLILAGIAEIGLMKLLKSSFFKTNLANFLYKASNAQLRTLVNKSPEITNIIDRIFGPKNVRKTPADILQIIEEENQILQQVQKQPKQIDWTPRMEAPIVAKSPSAVPAKSMGTVRDPKTGRMKKVYASGEGFTAQSPLDKSKRMSYDVGVTSATDRNPIIAEKLSQIKKLEELGDLEGARKIHNEILTMGENEVKNALAIKGVSFEMDKTIGNFFETTEPTFQLKVHANPEKMPEVIKNLSGASEKLLQKNIHFSKVTEITPETSFGIPDVDGWVTEPSFEITFSKPVSDQAFLELNKEIQRLGLPGSTMSADKTKLIMYNISKFKPYEQFFREVDDLARSIEGGTATDLGGVQTRTSKAARRLLNVGELEGGATRSYADIRGQNGLTSKVIKPAEATAGDLVSQAKGKTLEGINVDIPAKNTSKIGDYKLKDGEYLSEIKMVNPSELTGEQSFVDNKIVAQKIADIKAGKPIKPIVVVEGTVKDGYHTSEALTKLGYKEIPVVFVEMKGFEAESVAGKYKTYQSKSQLEQIWKEANKGLNNKGFSTAGAMATVAGSAIASGIIGAAADATMHPGEQYTTNAPLNVTIPKERKLFGMSESEIGEIIAQAESSGGKLENEGVDYAGKFGWVIGLEQQTYDDFVDSAKKGDPRYVELLKNINLDTKASAKKSAFDILKFKASLWNENRKQVGYKADNLEDAYADYYNASPGKKRVAARANFKKALEATKKPRDEKSELKKRIAEKLKTLE